MEPQCGAGAVAAAACVFIGGRVVLRGGPFFWRPQALRRRTFLRGSAAVVLARRGCASQDDAAGISGPCSQGRGPPSAPTICSLIEIRFNIILSPTPRALHPALRLTWLWPSCSFLAKRNGHRQTAPLCGTTAAPFEVLLRPLTRPTFSRWVLVRGCFCCFRATRPPCFRTKRRPPRSRSQRARLLIHQPLHAPAATH